MKKTVLFLPLLLLLASCRKPQASVSSSSLSTSSSPVLSESSSSSPLLSSSFSSSSSLSSEAVKPVLTVSYDKTEALDADHIYAVGESVKLEASLSPSPSSMPEILFSLRQEDESAAHVDEKGKLTFLAPKEEIMVHVSVPALAMNQTLLFTSVEKNSYYLKEVKEKLSLAYPEEKNLVKAVKTQGDIVEEISFFTDQKETVGKSSADSSLLYRKADVLEEGALDSYRFDKEGKLVGFSTKEADASDLKKLSSLTEGNLVSLSSLFSDPTSGYLGTDHLGSEGAKASLQIEKNGQDYTLSSAWTEEGTAREENLSLSFSADNSLSSYSFSSRSGEEESLLSYQLTYGTRKKSLSPLKKEDFYFQSDFEVTLESVSGRYEIGNTYELKVVKGGGNQLVDPLEIVSVSGKDEAGNDVAQLTRQGVRIAHEGEFTVTVHTLRSGLEKKIVAKAVYPAVTKLNVNPKLVTDTLELGQSIEYEVEVLPLKAKQGVQASVNDASLASVTKESEGNFKLQVKEDADVKKKLTVTFTAEGTDSDGKKPSVSFTYSLKKKALIADLKTLLTTTAWKVQGNYGKCSLVFRADGTGTCKVETMGFNSDVEAPFHYEVNGQSLSLVENEDDQYNDPYIDSLSYVSDSVQVHFTDSMGFTDETLTFTK